ncbi:DNA-primase RepB domain-containing protein [Ferrovum sp.]|uniref:DNA-primase RepB domain-containing protein n=1 Tax=Ferrovum sp. TaxID=2609467 RepID=UPI00260B3278|nr:DNA-primase RepB domain-containing protein [Ferrovum sp.]
MSEASRHLSVLFGFCETLEVGVLPYIGRDNERGLFSRLVGDNITGLLNWARFQNASQSAQIYVRPHSQNDHPWLFLDDVTKETALRISQKYASVAVETSQGNCQIRLLSSMALSCSERATVQKCIAPKIMADRASTAGDKWGRLAGFQNRKPGKEGWWTTIVADTSQASHRFDPEPFMSETNWSKGQSGSGKISPQGDRVFSQNGCGNCSESEREFAWVVNRIKWFMEQRPDRLQGDLPAMIENLTQRARSRGKRHPEAYAERTVAAAIQRVNY